MSCVGYSLKLSMKSIQSLQSMHKIVGVTSNDVADATAVCSQDSLKSSYSEDKHLNDKRLSDKRLVDKRPNDKRQ